MSGDMNTGLGNCLIMCALIWSYFSKRCRMELINNGDDCVVFLEQDDLHHMDNLPAWFHQMGYTMKVEPTVYDLEKVEFCQTQPVYDGNAYRMVRNPKVCLTKDLISVKNLETESAWKYQCQAISDCGMAAYGDMPIFCEFYKMLNQDHEVSRSDHLSTGFEFLSSGLNNANKEVTDEARFSFWKAFDITPDMQTDLEGLYRGLRPKFRPGPVDKFDNLLPTNTI
jgi:hypothetical protein